MSLAGFSGEKDKGTHPRVFMVAIYTKSAAITPLGSAISHFFQLDTY